MWGVNPSSKGNARPGKLTAITHLPGNRRSSRSPSVSDDGPPKPAVLASFVQATHSKLDPPFHPSARALGVLPSNPTGSLAKLSRVVKPVKNLLAEFAAQLLVLLKREKGGKGIFDGVKILRSQGASKSFPFCLPSPRVRVKRNHDRLNWMQMRRMRLHQGIAQGPQYH